MSDKPEKSGLENIKEASQHLRGTVVETLSADVDHFEEVDKQVLKFHGTYQQDNRDTRKPRRKQRLGKEYIFMVRTAIPGGKLTADQFLGELDLADRFGNGTLRITTRQGFQHHGVVKGNLRETIRGINELQLSTLAACGDVERNVMCCPAPHHHNGVYDELQATADRIAAHLKPRTRAYHEIWIADPETGEREKVVEKPADAEIEPIYGKAYMPRKFKTGIALPEDNCIDAYSQDVGLLGVVESGRLIGYNVLVGGGLGTTPSDEDCFPAVGKRMAFVPAEHVLPVVTAIVLVQRDHGNRSNRKQARMKYVVYGWGIEKFKAKVEEYLPEAAAICGLSRDAVPRPLAEPHPADVHGYEDHLGWHEQGNGKLYLGVPVENGRIKDEGDLRLKTVLRELFSRHRVSARLTPQQSLLLCDVEPTLRPQIDSLLQDHGVASIERISNARRFAMACPALPTCGLAITESERQMPSILDELEAELSKLGLADANFTVRMTGCPNGCARPYIADIGLVGRSIDGKSGEGKYTIFVGGNLLGTRINTIYKDLVPASQVVSQLVPLLLYYKQARDEGESLGDFCHRKGTEDLLRFDEQFQKQPT